MKELADLDVFLEKIDENTPPALWLLTVLFGAIALGGIFGFIHTHCAWWLGAAIVSAPLAIILNEICNFAAVAKTYEEMDDDHP